MTCVTLTCFATKFAAKLQRSVKPHPLKELHVEQVCVLLKAELALCCPSEIAVGGYLQQTSCHPVNDLMQLLAADGGGCSGGRCSECRGVGNGAEAHVQRVAGEYPGHTFNAVQQNSLELNALTHAADSTGSWEVRERCERSAGGPSSAAHTCDSKSQHVGRGNSSRKVMQLLRNITTQSAAELQCQLVTSTG